MSLQLATYYARKYFQTNLKCLTTAHGYIINKSNTNITNDINEHDEKLVLDNKVRYLYDPLTKTNNYVSNNIIIVNNKHVINRINKNVMYAMISNDNTTIYDNMTISDLESSLVSLKNRLDNVKNINVVYIKELDRNDYIPNNCEMYIKNMDGSDYMSIINSINNKIKPGMVNINKMCIFDPNIRNCINNINNTL